MKSQIGCRTGRRARTLVEVSEIGADSLSAVPAVTECTSLGLRSTVPTLYTIVLPEIQIRCLLMAGTHQHVIDFTTA